MAKTIVAKECRFAVHVPTRSPSIPDVHLIKEQIHYSDGTIEPNISYIKDFKRPIWITKKQYRNHEQKKEWENVDRLHRLDVTQSAMIFKAARALELGYVKDPREILGSAYVYGADVHSSTFIKNKYSTKYPDVFTEYSVATLDIETDTVNGTEDILMCTVVYKNEVYCCIDEGFIKGIANPIDGLYSNLNKYLGEYVTKADLKVTFDIVNGPMMIIKNCFHKLHTWKPDILAIWNMDFDITVILKQCEKYKVDPRTYLCDPSVPFEYRTCNYKKGPTKRVTASGKSMPLNPSLQWHTLHLTASFYVIDAMCAYRRLRLGQPEKPSYALDNILDAELGKRKLRFEETDVYSGLRWHQVMQSKYKLQYAIYNIFDTYGMMELENKTRDLCSSLPSMLDRTPFNKASSQPSMIADAFFFFLYKEKGKVLAATGKSPAISTILDDDVDTEDTTDYSALDLKGWILTLPSHMTVPGLRLIEEDETMSTNIRCYVSDSDSASAYPSAAEAANVSKENTIRELCSIKGIDEADFRLQNMNLLSGPVNAIEYMETMLDSSGLLDLDEL